MERLKITSKQLVILAQEYISLKSIVNDYIFYDIQIDKFTTDFKKVKGRHFLILKSYMGELEGYSIPISRYYPCMNMLEYISV